MLATRQTALRAAPLLLQQVRTISHIEKSKKLGRPVSPHVTIYEFPLAAWTSVGHRVSGGILTVGMYGVGIGALAGVDVTHLMSVLGHSSIGPLAKFLVAFPLTYHIGGGIRHLYWERFPDNLGPATQRQASIYLLGSTGVISLIVAML